MFRDKRNFVFLVGLLTTVVVIPDLLDPINLPKLFLITLGTGVTLGLFWREIGVGIFSSRKSLTLIVGLFMCSLFITSLFSPQPIFKSLLGTWGRNNGLLTYFCLAILFFVIAIQRTNYSMSMKFLSFLGIGSSVYGLIQSWGSDPIAWNNPGNVVILTLGNSNFASTLMALTAIACIVYFTIIKSFAKRMLLILFFLVQIYLILKSEAVQGLVTVFFGTSLFVGLLLLFSKRLIFRKVSLLWWSSLFAFGIIGLLSLFRLGPLASLMTPYLFSFRDRYYHWVAAINMMRKNPFIGVGIDSFGDFYRQYRVQEAIDVRGTASFGTNNAHNTFLQFGATGGLVLLFAYVTLMLFIGYRSIIALKLCQNKTLVSGVFSVWITFQVQTLVSIDQIGIVIWGWILGGCLVSASYYPAEEKQEVLRSQLNNKSHRTFAKNQKSASVFVVFVVLLPTVTLVPTLINEFTLRENIVSLVSSSTTADLESRVVNVVLSAEKSRHPELRLQAINYLLAMKQNDAALSLALLNNKEFPDSYESWDATAQIYEGLGDKERAIYPRQRSVELDPLNLEIKKLLEADQVKN